MSSKFYNNVKTACLLAAFTALVMVVGQLVGGRQGLIIAFLFAGFSNFIAYFFSDKIALASMSAQEVGPEHRLYGIVQELAQRGNLPMPRVYVSPQAAPNAFATGRSPSHAAVCATEGLLDLLDRKEVAGVMAHELAHVKNRDMLISTVAATMAGAISMLANMWFWMGMGGGRRGDDEEQSPLAAVGGILTLLLAPVAAMLIQFAISRSREFNADKVGAEICGDPMALATALEKVHYGASAVPLDVAPAFNALMIAPPRNSMESLAKLFSTHPALEDRVNNLIGQPQTGRIHVRQTIAY